MRLHAKHGLNPTMAICFWCGETREILLLGASYEGEAPREMLTDYEPCDNCKSLMDGGVTLLEVSEAPKMEGLKPIQDRYYPTGRWMVIKEEAVSRVFNKDSADIALKAKKALVDQEAYSRLA